MNTFTLDSKTMHYLDKGEGPVLVFGHSYLWDSEMWAPQVEVLSNHYRCIVPDLWAHGQSDAAPAKTRTLKDYACDVMSLMDHLDIDTFSLIGLSAGGMWGAELTALAPLRVKSLVMMDTFVGLEPEVTHKKYSCMLDAIEAAQHIPAPLVDIITPMFFARDAEQVNPELIAKFRSRLTSFKGQQAIEITKIGRMIFGRRDAFDELESFTLPTLIMVGDQDMPRPHQEAQLMQSAVKGSELVIVPDAGHISNLEQPTFVSERLLCFLEKVHA